MASAARPPSHSDAAVSTYSVILNALELILRSEKVASSIPLDSKDERSA
jgi:hypothetical protein